MLRAVEGGARSDACSAALAGGRRVKHPAVSDIDRQKVSELEDASTQPGLCSEAGEILGGLIDRVVLALNALRRTP